MEHEESDFGKLDENNKSIKTGFDALDIASNVHEKTKTLNRDIIIARTTLPLEQWGRNQILFTDHMTELLEGHKQKAEQWNMKKAINIIEKEQEELTLSYLGELQLLHGYTRSRDGVTHDALIKIPKKEEDNLSNIKERVDLLSKINSKPIGEEDDV